MGLDELRRNPLPSAAAIGTGAIAGGVGTAAIVLGKKHAGKFAANSTIMRTAAAPLVVGALVGGAGMGLMAAANPDAARNTSLSLGITVAGGGALGAWTGARQWKQATEVQRHGMPMWRFAGSHAVSSIGQRALPLVAMNVAMGGFMLLKGSRTDS